MRQLCQRVALIGRHRRDYKSRNSRKLSAGFRRVELFFTWLMTGPIAETFHRISSQHRNRIAVYGLSEEVTRTFAELRDDVSALEGALCALPVPSPATIIANVGNRTGFVPLFLASVGLGSNFIPLDGGTSAREVLDLADVSGADLVVVPAEAEPFRPMAPVSLPCGLWAIVRRRTREPSWRAPHETDALILKVTSGSTGPPRLAVTAEASLLADGRHIIDAMAIETSDVSVATVPMAHAYGMGNLLLPLLLKGSPVVLRDRFVHGQWASDVQQYGVTMFPGVPFIFDYLRRVGDASPLRGIRLVVTAGAPIDLQTVEYFKDHFSVKIHSLYGTTETGSITYDSSDGLSDRVSVGWPMPETTVTLTPSSGFNPDGRILVKGSAVSRGYTDGEALDDSSPAFTAAGFLTADIGRWAADGQLILLGRTSRFVNVAGRKVNPAEVERVIAELPDVIQAWVMGVPNEIRGQDLVACVTRRSAELSAASIRTHCAVTLSPHKVPRRIVFADAVPLTERGKTSRQTLEALLNSSSDLEDSL